MLDRSTNSQPPLTLLRNLPHRSHNVDRAPQLVQDLATRYHAEILPYDAPARSPMQPYQQPQLTLGSRAASRLESSCASLIICDSVPMEVSEQGMEGGVGRGGSEGACAHKICMCVCARPPLGERCHHAGDNVKRIHPPRFRNRRSRYRRQCSNNDAIKRPGLPTSNKGQRKVDEKR